MTTVSFEVYLPRVLPDVIGCPEPTALQAIRDAAIEFCEKSQAIQLDLAIDAAAGVNEYDLGLSAGVRCASIMRAFYKDTPLKPAPADMAIDADLYRDPPSGGSSTPSTYLQKEAAKVSFLPTPSDTLANAFTMRVAVQPDRDATAFDAALYQDYAETIAHGAKARLMASPHKAWTNLTTAPAERAFFLAGINLAKLRTARARTRGQLRFSIPRI